MSEDGHKDHQVQESGWEVPASSVVVVVEWGLHEVVCHLASFEGRQQGLGDVVVHCHLLG